MDIYKDYLQQLRKFSFKEVYILIGEDYTPKLTNYVYLLTEVKYDHDAYFLLYDQFKKIISSFKVFHSQCADDVTKGADKCANVMDRDELLRLIEGTISTHHNNQIAFGKQFLPVKNAEEKRVYVEIETEFNGFMEKVYEFREHLKTFDKKEVIDDFASVHFDKAVTNTGEVFAFTNTFIAMMLADRLDQIRVSIEEIYSHMNNNLTRLRREHETCQNELLHQLYEKNKESLMALRRDKRCSIQNAEVQKGIEIARKKLENFEMESPLQRIEEETSYWQERFREFHVIKDNLIKLKAEQVDITEQEKIYNSLQSFDPPGTKEKKWRNIGLNYAEKKEYCKQMIIKEARSLVTFFAVRGYDRIIYTDNKGPYYVDEFKHQVYVSEHALYLQHVTCEGDMIDVQENVNHFDKNGRYIMENGEKIYQCAPCTSKYKLTENNLFEKITKDCGHTEKVQGSCGMEVKDPNIVLVLPDFLPMDIRKSLDTETVKYLWDSFGSLLPDALYDVCSKTPRNPIHMLAHRLLYHKYSRTTQELAQKKKESEQYRQDIYKKRHDKAVSASKAWKAKQTARRKPEESDDAQERAVFDAQKAELDYVNYLNYYYNYEL